MEFYDAWWWLNYHPINNKPAIAGDSYNMGMDDLDIYITKVNPKTNTNEHSALNTKIMVWLEFGPFTNYASWERSHDPRLDCGGDTFEEAVKTLASLVKQYYGDYV